MRSPRLVRTVRVTQRVQLLGQHAPGVDRIRLELQCAPKGHDRVARVARFALGDGEFNVDRSGPWLLAGERLEHLERELRMTGDAVCRAENQPRMRMTRNGLEDLTRLLGRECRIPLQQSGCMPQRNVQCSNWLRYAVQLNIQ